jgi:hypothetical protein
MASRSMAKPSAGLVDHREQLCNERETGPINTVSLPLVNITRIHGISFDLDINLFRTDGPVPLPLGSVEEFTEQTLKPMLARHPALRGAEIRDSGRNVHAILWFDQSVVLDSDAERDRWKAIVEIIQAALPIDPDMPGITNLTRPVGSINGKTGRPVRILKAGTPVPVAEILKLHDQMLRAPFKTISGILFGSDWISPCPSCGVAGTMLKALDRDGRCYGSCGKVQLERLYDAFLVPRALAGKEVKNAKG